MEEIMLLESLVFRRKESCCTHHYIKRIVFLGPVVTHKNQRQYNAAKVA